MLFRSRVPRVPWLAMTATATPLIKQRVAAQLGFDSTQLLFCQLSNQCLIKYLAAVLEDGQKSTLFSELD